MTSVIATGLASADRQEESGGGGMRKKGGERGGGGEKERETDAQSSPHDGEDSTRCLQS